jgi:hypothetical protein
VIGLFKQKSPANLIILLIFGLLIKMPLFLYPKAITATPQDGRLYEAFLSLFTTPGKSNDLFLSVVAFALLYIQALLINYLVNEQRMTNRQTFLPAMSYLLITSLVPEWNYLSSTLVATTITIWIFIKVFKLYNANNASGAIFNIGLLLGINSFFFFPSLAFILPVVLGLMILRPFKFNEFVLLLLGITTPYYFYIAYLFLTDKLILSNILPQFSIQLPVMKNELLLAIAMVFLGTPFIIGGFYIQSNLRKMLIQARKNWSILLLYLFLSLLIPFINSHGSLDKWIVVAAPFAAFHTCAYLYPRRQFVPLILFFLTLAFVLVQQYATPLWKI